MLQASEKARRRMKNNRIKETKAPEPEITVCNIPKTKVKVCKTPELKVYETDICEIRGTKISPESEKKINPPKKSKNQDMPYERFLRFGPENLTESELLAIILRTGTKEVSALELAERVLELAKYPKEGLLGLYDITLEELTGIKGIGMVKAIKLKCLTELSMRISCARAKQGICFTRSQKVAEYYMERLRHRNTECVYLLCLDAKGQLLREKKLSDGSVRMALISPREIFLEALQSRAVNIILLHNHPSG
ncbi:MAG: DNA repair protein RadC, partial [Lachnospiraceae bacterium]|nr:DNA repair protein RadC [Lachnospiraceae bacterium]